MSDRDNPGDPFYSPPRSYDFDDSYLLPPDASTNFRPRPVPRFSPPTRQEPPITLDSFSGRRPEPDHCRAPDASTSFQPVPWPRSSPPIRREPSLSVPLARRTTNREGQPDNVPGPLTVPSAPSGLDRPLTYINEGGDADQRLHGYVPNVGGGSHIHPSPTSGITVAAGIDFAQFTREELILQGFQASSLAVMPDMAFAHRAKPGERDKNGHPYKPGTMVLGARGNDAQTILDTMKTPLNLSENEASAASGHVYNTIAARTRTLYDAAAGTPRFDKLSDAQKTVIVDLGYARGAAFGLAIHLTRVVSPPPTHSKASHPQRTHIVRTYTYRVSPLGKLRTDVEMGNWKAVPQGIRNVLGAGDRRAIRDIKKLQGN